MTIRFKPKPLVSEVEMRGHIDDFFHQEGYFPLTLKTDHPFRLDRRPIWEKTSFGAPLCVFHHPQLESWPAITMYCDIFDNRLLFAVDHWKSVEWCAAQPIYVDCPDVPKLAQSMIASNPMHLANMGY